MEDFLLAIKPTFPDRQMLESRIFTSTHLAIIETSLLTLEECVCDQYHFLIPLRQAPVIRTGNKLYPLKEANVFPCNPLQPHQIKDTGIADFKAIVLYLENSFLRRMAEELFGHRNLELVNQAFAFTPALQEVIKAFMVESQANQPGGALMLESLSVQAAILLLRESQHNLTSLPFQSRDFQDRKCIEKAIEFITDNYQSEISLSDLAFATHYSPYHFLRLFKQHTGKTPFQFLLDLKIEKAKTLLEKTDYSITEICYLAGFSSSSYFSQAFKKKTGVSPSQYKLIV